MAKKRAASATDINVSAEIREVLEANPQFSGREVYEAVTAKYPGSAFNEKSFQVAYSNARRRMGLGRKKRIVRKVRPVAMNAAKRIPRRTARSSAVVTAEQLHAAAEFVTRIGGTTQARAALTQLAALQIQ